MIRARIAGTFAVAVSGLLFSLAVHAQEHETKVGDITIIEAWARATPATTGGVFVTVRNDGTVPDRLIGVSTDAAEMAHLHEGTRENGITKMRGVDGIDIPPRTTVTLKPGGTHIMLMGLAKPLKLGDSFPISLTFAVAGTGTVTVVVRSAGATGAEKP